MVFYSTRQRKKVMADLNPSRYKTPTHENSGGETNINGWEKTDSGNAVFAYEKGDWAISLIQPDKYNPNAEVRIINFESGKKIIISGSPSILLKLPPKDIIKKAEMHIKREQNEKV